MYSRFPRLFGVVGAAAVAESYSAPLSRAAARAATICAPIAAAVADHQCLTRDTERCIANLIAIRKVSRKAGGSLIYLYAALSFHCRYLLCKEWELPA
jgi:hypothetical protein